MAQICKLSSGRKYPNTRKGRVMIRDPRQKIATDNFSLREKALNGDKMIKINSSKSNKSKVLALGDKGIRERKMRKCSSSYRDSLKE